MGRDALTPEQRTLRAQIAAHSLHAQGKTNTLPARSAFMERFEREVDPDGELPVSERRKRAQHAMTAYMKSLSLKAAQKRSQEKAEKGWE